MKAAQPSRNTLIIATLRVMAMEGWTESALARAEADFAPGTMRAYFPAGLSDFIKAFHAWVDEGMEKHLAKNEAFETAKVREKIFEAVMARLAVLRPHKEAVRRFLGYQLLPWNGPRAVMGLGHAADAMWKAAGDRSTDYNYYTKRLLLSGVYAATLHCWLKDHSKDEAETEAFLRRRIEEVLKVGKAIGGLKDRFKKAA
jgi:ubiquinone biosynthesis protein COQ9